MKNIHLSPIRKCLFFAASGGSNPGRGDQAAAADRGGPGQGWTCTTGSQCSPEYIKQGKALRVDLIDFIYLIPLHVICFMRSLIKVSNMQVWLNPSHPNHFYVRASSWTWRSWERSPTRQQLSPTSQLQFWCSCPPKAESPKIAAGNRPRCSWARWFFIAASCGMPGINGRLPQSQKCPLAINP